jgi:hypothetical protein
MFREKDDVSIRNGIVITKLTNVDFRLAVKQIIRFSRGQYSFHLNQKHKQNTKLVYSI